MKRHALDNLNLGPKLKPLHEPPKKYRKSIEDYFVPQRRRTGDAVSRPPEADGKQDVVLVNEEHEEERTETKAETGVALSDEQERILRMVVHEEKNIFYTGSAGLFKLYATTFWPVELRDV